MVGPNKKTQQTNGQHGINHGTTTKNSTATNKFNNQRTKTKNGKDNNINLRVAKKPKQMLKQQKITTTQNIIKGGINITVKQNHGNTTGQNGKTQNQKEGSNQNTSKKQTNKQKIIKTATANKQSTTNIQRINNTRNTQQMNGKQNKITGTTGMKINTNQGGIQSPTNTNTLLNNNRQQNKQTSNKIQPKTQIIQTGKQHIGATNTQGKPIINKTTQHNGHNKSKNHNQTMGGNNTIIKLVITKQNKNTKTR